jgi:predicted  nucleic acid-binding Zn-ribbon protein
MNNKYIEQLYELQKLEINPASENVERAEQIKRLRESIPPQIIAHYDRLMARGKKGISVVRNGVCGECHMRLASGIFAELVRGEDIKICDSCGRYFYAAEGSAPSEQPAVAQEEKPAKPRRRKKKEEPAPTVES